MLRRFTILFSIIWLYSSTSLAQQYKEWSLEDCIQYAVEHNIDLQRQSITVEKRKVAIQQGKWAFVPSLSINSNYTMSTGRVLDPTTYQFDDISFTGNSASSISGDMAVYSGRRSVRTLKKAKLSLRAAHIQEEMIKQDLRINVVAAYMDVLCAKEQTKIAEESASLIQEQLNKSQVLFDAGSITESDILQLKSKLFEAQNDVVSARNSTEMAYLALCNLLEIDDYKTFRISVPVETAPEPPVLNVDEAVENNPEYRSSVIDRELAESEYKIASSSLTPTISLSVGYGSSFSDARKRNVLQPDGSITVENYPFFKQYYDNASAYATVGLKIPIFGNMTARSNVKTARLAIKEAEYNIQVKKKDVRTKILKAKIDCESAYDVYKRSILEVEYAQEAQRQIDEKYNLGAADYLSWSTALVESAKARYALAEAKYTYILKAEIMGFYAQTCAF